MGGGGGGGIGGPPSVPGPCAHRPPPTCELSGTTRKRFYGGRAGPSNGWDWSGGPRAPLGLASAVRLLWLPGGRGGSPGSAAPEAEPWLRWRR